MAAFHRCSPRGGASGLTHCPGAIRRCPRHAHRRGRDNAAHRRVHGRSSGGTHAGGGCRAVGGLCRRMRHQRPACDRVVRACRHQRRLRRDQRHPGQCRQHPGHLPRRNLQGHQDTPLSQRGPRSRGPRGGAGRGALGGRYRRQPDQPDPAPEHRAVEGPRRWRGTRDLPDDLSRRSA